MARVQLRLFSFHVRSMVEDNLPSFALFRQMELLRENRGGCPATPITLYVTRQKEAPSSRTVKSLKIRWIGSDWDSAAIIAALDQTFPEAPNSIKSSAIREDASSADNFLPT